MDDEDGLEDEEPTRAKTEARGTLSAVDACRLIRWVSTVCAVECARCVGAMMEGQNGGG